MIEITRTLRVLAGGLAAGAIGVTALAGATASAEPARPAPPAPGIAAPAPAPQNAPALAAQGSNSLLAAPTAPTPPAAIPAVSGTLREYLQAKGVKLEAQKLQGFTGLNITLPVPPRWTQVPDPNVPDAFAVIADRQGNSVYSSNAQLVVYKLSGDFDPKDAITHGYVDSQKLPVWQTTNASMADLGGFPSSVIEGTYRDGDMTLSTSRRNVIATSGHDTYLVSLAVTTDRAVAVGDGPSTDAIVNGFRVAAPGAPAQAPAPPTPPVAAVAPAGQSPVAQAPVAQAPAGQSPVEQAPVAQAPVAQTPVGLPAQAAVPNQPLVAPTPSILAMVPGLPPLPNFSFLQH